VNEVELLLWELTSVCYHINEWPLLPALLCYSITNP